jgi:hypothetical protein
MPASRLVVADRAGDQRRHDGDRHDDAEKHRYSRRDGAEADECRPLTGDGRSMRAEVGVESHQHTLAVDWDDGGTHLVRAGEDIASTADVQTAADGVEESLPRLPDDSVGKVALHAEAFLALHPVIDLGKGRRR